jgi:hypothetical protein
MMIGGDLRQRAAIRASLARGNLIASNERAALIPEPALLEPWMAPKIAHESMRGESMSAQDSALGWRGAPQVAWARRSRRL